MHRWLCLLLVLFPLSAFAGVDCSVDDVITGAAWSTYVSAGEKTLMLWYNNMGAVPVAGGACSGVATNEALVANASTNRIFISLRRADRFCVGNNDGATDSKNSDGTTSSVFHHVVLRHTGGTLAMYLDGTEIETPEASGNTTVLTDLMTVCNASGLMAPVSVGRVEYLATYNVAVPIAEIQYLAKNRTPRIKKTRPTGEWYFDNCAIGANCNGVAFRDHSGNGNTLTGDDGANNTGLVGTGLTHLRWHGGIN